MTNEKDQLSPNWPSIFELASTINQVDIARLGRPGSARKNAPPVTQGLIPQPFPVNEGYFEVTPEQLASLKVPKIEVGSTIRGFQREKVNQHVRKIAMHLRDGGEVPPLIISIFPDGNAYVDDGQHRALAAIVARKDLEVVVKRRSVDEARQLFANQGKAKTVRTDDTLLTGNSALELYIQDALTNDEHPWSKLVTPNSRGSTNRMTPTTMAQMVGSFVFNAFNQGANFYTSRDDNDFDTRRADLLAELVEVFGNRSTNPFAFRGRTLRAIAYAATHVFRRNPQTKQGDVERWKSHMPKFDFSRYPHLLVKETDLAYKLVEHWNKHLPDERRVHPYHFS